MKRAAPSWVSQPPIKASGSSSRDRGKVWVKHPPANKSDDEPLSDRADEQKAKNRKWDPTPELVILEDDDSTPLPGKIKGMGKKARTHTLGEDEGFEALSQCLKGEARAIQYNLELAILIEYQNLHIPNLKGPPNTNNHLAYLSNVKVELSSQGKPHYRSPILPGPEGQQRPGGDRSGRQCPAGEGDDGDPTGEPQGWANQVLVCHFHPP